jgi:hypothetical protein
LGLDLFELARNWSTLRDAREQFAGYRCFHGELSPKVAKLQKGGSAAPRAMLINAASPPFLTSRSEPDGPLLLDPPGVEFNS